MKRLVFVALVFCAAFFFEASAQSLEVIETSPVIIHGTPDQTLLEFHLSVRNISNSAKTVKAKIVPLDVNPNHTLYFCWTNCYAPGILESPDEERINPGETNTKFVAYLRPNGVSGISKIECVFFVSDNPDDKASVIAEFQVNPVSHYAEKSRSSAFLQAVQSSNGIQIRYQIPESSRAATLTILNVLGRKIREYQLPTSSGTLIIESGLFPPGLYFGVLQRNGKPLLTKTIVLP